MYVPGTDSKCKVCYEEEKKHLTYLCCQVCYELQDSEQFFFLKECGHEYCKSCVNMHLQKLIDTCEVSKLKCLNYECRATFSEEEIRQVLDND